DPAVLGQYREALAHRDAVADHDPTRVVTPTLGSALRLTLGGGAAWPEFVPAGWAAAWLGACWVARGGAGDVRGGGGAAGGGAGGGGAVPVRLRLRAAARRRGAARGVGLRPPRPGPHGPRRGRPRGRRHRRPVHEPVARAGVHLRLAGAGTPAAVPFREPPA